MIGRLSFLHRFAAIVAVVALAPEIAFGAKLNVSAVADSSPVIETLDLDALFAKVYELKRARESLGLETTSPALPGFWEQIKEIA